MDWIKIRNEYESSEISLSDLAVKHGLKYPTIKSRKQRESWNKDASKVASKDASKKGSKNKTKTQDPRLKIVVNNKEIGFDESLDLTERQRLFCLYYIKSFNGTMSATKAGYAADSAHVTASQLLRNPKVSTEIKRLKGQLQEGVFVDAMDVLDRYIKIAFADMNDFIEFGQEEVSVMGMFGPVEIEDPVTHEKKPLTKIVNVLKFKESSTLDGGLICQIKQGKDGASIKLEDRQKALDKLALYFDLFPDKFQRRIEEEKLKLDKLKITGEGQGNDQEGIKNFIEATTMSEAEIKAMFEGDSDEGIQEKD